MSPSLCVTIGETREDALRMIRDAVKGYLEGFEGHEDPVPPGLEKGIEAVEVEVAARVG